MKQLFNIKLRLLLVLLPVIMALAKVGAQNSEIVYAGQTSMLSVQEIPGHSYTWELYSNVEGLNFAQHPGNCPPDQAYFTDSDTGPSVTVMWVSPGLYFFKVTAYNPEGCMNLKVGKIEVNEPLPTAEFIDSQAVCYGEIAVVTVLLSGTPPFGISYTDGTDTIIENNIINYTFDLLLNPLTTTSYWITEVVDAYGFPNNELIGPSLVTVNPMPEIIIINVTHAYDGQPNGGAEIIASSAALPLTYSIDGINWQNDHFITGLMPGSYLAMVRDENHCVAEMPFDVHNIVTGEIDIMAGTITGCQNSLVETPVIVCGFTDIISFTLELEFNHEVLAFEGVENINPALKVGEVEGQNQKDGTLVISFYSPIPVTIDHDQSLFYMQFTGVGNGRSLLNWQNPQCVFVAAGNYPVPTIYTHGEIEIMPAPQPIVIGSGNYCEGDFLELSAQIPSGMDISYQWQGPKGINHSGNSLTLGYLSLDHSGAYTLIAVDDLGCKSFIDFDVIVNPLPEVSLITGEKECMDGPVWLEPGVWYASYKWQDGSTQTSFLATKEGEYWVEVTDENGCSNVASVTLKPCELEFLIPNAFTPNGDGLNDVFLPVYVEVNLPRYTLLIFNRWGQLLFESNQISIGWDGTINGKPAPTDVYTYVITYELPAHFDNRELKRIHGNLMLLR
jgi:gliding motility-associated-like protein